MASGKIPTSVWNDEPGVPLWKAGHKEPPHLPPNTEVMQLCCTTWRLLGLGGMVARDCKHPHAALLLLAVPTQCQWERCLPLCFTNLIHKPSSSFFCNLLQLRSDLQWSCRISKTDLHRGLWGRDFPVRSACLLHTARDTVFSYSM